MTYARVPDLPASNRGPVWLGLYQDLGKHQLLAIEQQDCKFLHMPPLYAKRQELRDDIQVLHPYHFGKFWLIVTGMMKCV